MTPTQRLNIRLAICRVIDAGGRFDAAVSWRRRQAEVWCTTGKFPSGVTIKLAERQRFDNHLWICSLIEQIQREGTAQHRAYVREQRRALGLNRTREAPSVVARRSAA